MGQVGTDIDADLQLLDNKMKACKLGYEQYFRGARPRPPTMERQECQKIVNMWSNLPIHNTANRFRFNTLTARFFSFRRQWDEVLRKIEAGTYAPHKFKADKAEELQQRGGASPTASNQPVERNDIYQDFIDARMACGEATKGVSREKIDALVKKQRAAIQQKYGCSDVKFKVVVEDGKTKLKATPVQ